ncbi:6-pyruvoyl tetrahydropterin synthase [Weizmannia phage Youna2]
MLQQFYPQVQHDYQYELNKDMNFSAAHYVPHPGAGVCARVHGHTYFVNITIAGDELDDMGFLANFADLKKVVHGRYDHTLMNDHPEFTYSPNDDPNMFPTTEVVARQIFEHVQHYLDKKPNKPKCLQVIVRETPTTYVVYRPKGTK